VDLHTHFGYQKFTAEAIAVVCSPKDKEQFKIFRIKDCHLDEIGNCKKRGHHKHTFGERDGFEECQHVELVEKNASHYAVCEDKRSAPSNSQAQPSKMLKDEETKPRKLKDSEVCSA
jgi:hypothetical protein